MNLRKPVRMLPLNVFITLGLEDLRIFTLVLTLYNLITL